MTVSVFASAAEAFAELVRQIPDSAWSGPGLGEWDLRALVGHTSRSLITVSTYLKAPCDRQDIDSPAQYYAMIRQIAATMGTADIVERGRQAGRDLGPDPAATVASLVAQVRSDVAGVANGPAPHTSSLGASSPGDANDPLITVIGGLGIQLRHYLPTRTFELAVHGRDIARAAHIEFRLPEDVLDEATTLAARIAVAIGDGDAVLMALTGRGELPPSFSVV
jgi:uncharacterized protein (TIGR03083 family)